MKFIAPEFYSVGEDTKKLFKLDSGKIDKWTWGQLVDT